MLMNPHATEMAQAVTEEGVKILTTGAGIPSVYMPKWKENGIFVMPVVSSVALAKKMEKLAILSHFFEFCDFKNSLSFY